MELHEYSQQRNEEYLMRVLNKKYWPHQFNVSPTKIEQAERWCYANLKSANWRNVGITFAFKKEEDVTFFVLQL